MLKPFVGEPVPFADYFTKGSLRLHGVGILGGVIWNLGMAFSIIASSAASPALSYGLGQGATMVAAFWGICLEGVQRCATGHWADAQRHVPVLSARAWDSDRRPPRMKKGRILVVGSLNTDMIVRLDRLPGQGETMIGGRFSTAAGGKGANQAVGAARAGGRVTFVGRIGSDELGRSALANLRRDGVDVRYVVRDLDAPSGVAFIFVARGGENSIAVASGANDRLSSADVGRASPAFRQSDVLLVQLETPLAAVARAIALAFGAGARVILNPAPARPLSSRLLRCVSILTPNEHEAELLTGIKVNDESGAARAAEALLRRGVGAVIVTLGARGAFVADSSSRKLVRGFKVKAVDTTAAGDIFNGALAVALAENRELPDAVRFAQAAAAISVTRPGAQPSAPLRAEIDRLEYGNPKTNPATVRPSTSVRRSTSWGG